MHPYNVKILEISDAQNYTIKLFQSLLASGKYMHTCNTYYLEVFGK